MIIGIIIALLIIASIAATIGELKRLKITKTTQTQEENQEPNTNNTNNYPYKKKNLFTKSEYVFFKKLNNATKSKNIIIFTKIRLEDFIETTTFDNRQKYRGYIKSRHVDFILCDANSLQILAAIELDDPSHHTTKAQKTDKFKNELFEAIGIRLLRIKTGTDFQCEINKIIDEIKLEQ